MQLRALAFIALIACDSAPHTEAPAAPVEASPGPVELALTDPAPALGTITPAGACTLPTLFVGATCERHVVACDGLADATVNLVIAEPPPGVAPRGTILLGSGSAGATLIEKAATDPATGKNPLVSEMEKLRKNGYRIIERAWQGATPADRGWLRGDEGPDASACRYATLATWLAERYTADPAFCALGFSGGSMELAMAMSRWHIAPVLDQAVFVSGPVAHFDTACVGGPEAVEIRDEVLATHPWECTTPPLSEVLGDDITFLLDTSYSNTPVCSSRNPVHAETLYADSVLSPEGSDAFPTTSLAVVLGMKDCGSGAATGGAHFATLITGRGLPPTVVDVPAAGHSLHATPHGARALREVLQADCKAP